jgi:hypothetical protein
MQWGSRSSSRNWALVSPFPFNVEGKSMKAVSWIMVLCLGACMASTAFAQDDQVPAGGEQGGEAAASMVDVDGGASSGAEDQVAADATGPRPPILMAFNQTAASNSCSAPAYQSCPPCQVSCPGNMIAFCAPGAGYQTMGPGGIWTYQCWVQPQCFCRNP